ncbi:MULTISPECIES: hypothetical protein [unclassified Rhodococcus (in: high G+C Gram-positive bacteria)]|uniref:hypothetical protein n=1 Tax=unclassified Rhodococcus (in: high G+C Gram-positive bacteria) TaxID=192944 RepID=UPI0020CBDADB|nr:MULTISPECIES: hypothetical protein [unclassified Rhodococcus (in: high G+C Gram-positive bacteria)]
MHSDGSHEVAGDVTDNQDNREEEAPLSVGVVSDDGFASTVASSIIENLPDHAMIDGQRRELRVSGASVPLPPTATGSAPLGQWLAAVRATDDYDIVLCVSEVPRRLGSRPVIAELRDGTTGAVYVPSFGTLAVRRRATTAALAVLHELIEADDSSRPPRRYFKSSWIPSDSGEGDEVLVTSSILGRIRLISGMIRCIRPWRLVPTLSGALAAASAASAFGVFYASICQMAASMSVMRLAMIGVAAVMAMTVWVIFPNGLWEKRSFRSSTIDRWMYNAATLGTVLTGALCMYALLFAVVLLSAAVVISPVFLAVQIDRTATLGDYFSLAWLAASLGTVAGAVGSSVADREDILGATYGHRELIRRQSATPSS